MEASDSPHVTLAGLGLTAADVVAVARRNAPVSLAAEARTAMEHSAGLIDGFVASEEPVYGVTTGFGALAGTVIAAERTAELQVALVRSHAAGMGPEVEREVVRAMLLLRARSLAMARSGARPELVDLQLALLNAGITPVVHEHGSLGASGDLAPLSHCAMTLIGEGEARNADGIATQPAGDDVEIAGVITAGPNRTCDTQAVGDDLQLQGVGFIGGLFSANYLQEKDYV